MKWPGVIATMVTGLSLAMAGWAEEGEVPFRLGVQTHFEQNWNLRLIGRAHDLGAVALRDEIAWAKVERTPGNFNFSVADAYMLPILKRGMSPLIVITDANPLYDDGHTPHSPEGREALARFLSAMLTRYGAGTVQLEIGNEVNSDDFVNGPARDDPPRYIAAMVRRVRAVLDIDHPEARIICAGLNSISIGFFREFFRHGGLQSCDAVSVHPYRDNPDTVVGELDRLKALMREFGGERPIYVTEFGKWFDDPEEAPDFMMKMVAQLGAAGVVDAYWYALIDEPWWPNMGLFGAGGHDKPAAAAFRLLQDRLLPLGRPAARSTDSAIRLFEFGTSGRGFVVWGAGGAVSVSGDAEFFDTRGNPIDPVTLLSDMPVVILGQGLEVQVDLPVPVADTKYQFNDVPWSYFALRPEDGLTPLEIIDWNWTSHRGAPDLSPLRIGDDSITTARFQDGPFHAVERFTARAAGLHRIEGWWQASEKPEPSRLIVRHNRETVTEAEITIDRFSLPELTLSLQKGDTVDFEIAPGGPNGDGSVRRRIRVRGPLAEK